MLYSKLSDLYSQLESTTKILEMRRMVAEFLKTVPDEVLHDVALLITGRIFPEFSEREIGVANSLMLKAISRVSGASEPKINNMWRETGDLGLAARKAMEQKSQHTLTTRELLVEDLVSKARKMSELEGPGTVDRKVSIVSELFSNADTSSVVYLVRTILGQMRLGVGEGIVRDAIAAAFEADASEVERAHNIICDYGEVALLAKKKKLGTISLQIGRPYKVMLPQKADSVSSAFDKVGKPCAFEFKYDGMRIQVHKEGDTIKLFTRRLDDVTKQFPEIVAAAKRSLNSKHCIVEGEVVGYVKGEPVPFQEISRRIKRKYNIDEMSKKIPTVIFLFDCVFDGDSILDKPFDERRKILSSIVRSSESLQLAEQLVTGSESEANEFFEKSLSNKQEGLIAKNLKAKYKPGSRVGYMLKLKPVAETLDLVIVGAEWGEGKRSNWLSSFQLACRSEKGLLPIGKMATGLTDAQFEEITATLKPLITHQSGRKVKLKPKLVVEVGYQEIQRSPTYKSGFALRFPKLIRIREDKGINDADTLGRVNELHASGGRVG
jgi:DNA ligase-1